MLTYGSVCSGIGTDHLAWATLGWRCAFFAEIEAFPAAVLAQRFPDVPNLGDFTKIGAEHGPIDLLAGGTPCQSFSVAGKRAGLDDPRGNLTLEYLALAGRLRPRWLVWENVPGVLSDDGGRTFGTVLGLLGQLGYGFAWRLLDAQYFGVPQRRRRVFLVGHLGAWQPAAAVLLEPESMRGDPAPRRQAGQDAARPVASSPRGGSGYRNDSDTAENLIAFNGRQDPVPGETAGALDSDPSSQVVAFAENSRAELRLEGGDGQTAGSLKAGGGKAGQSYPAVQQGMAVRRLMPVECERLQGLPDHHTRTAWRGRAPEACPDGPRYRAIGNAWARPVAAWIGERLDFVHRVVSERAAA